MTFSPNPRGYGEVPERSLLQFHWQSDTGVHSSLIRLGRNSYSFSRLPTELWSEPRLTLYCALHLRHRADIVYLHFCLFGHMGCCAGQSAFNCLASAEHVSSIHCLSYEWVLPMSDYQLVEKVWSFAIILSKWTDSVNHVAPQRPVGHDI